MGVMLPALDHRCQSISGLIGFRNPDKRLTIEIKGHPGYRKSQKPSLSDTVSALERFDVERTRSTIHNWVQKADLQLSDGKQPDHIAIDETVIQLTDQPYWLYATADPTSMNSAISGSIQHG